jgi:nucleoside-diphosphate kinase
MFTFGILKPDLISYPQLASEALHAILRSSLAIHRAALIRIQHEQAIQLYAEHRGKFFYNRLIRVICCGPSIVMELHGDRDPIREWRKLVGPSKFLRGYGSEQVDRESFRWKYALSDVRNAAHGADSRESAERELAIFDPILRPFDAKEIEKWSRITAEESLD